MLPSARQSSVQSWLRSLRAAGAGGGGLVELDLAGGAAAAKPTGSVASRDLGILGIPRRAKDA